MKKVLLFLVLLFVGQTTFAQINDIYINDGVVLSGNQWHFDNYSVIEANNGNYLVIYPNGYNYQYLPAFAPRVFENLYHERVYSFKPYVFNNCLGWYVDCPVHDYFYYPNGTLVTLNYVPVFHNFYYTLRHLRHINLRNWYWRRPDYYRPHSTPLYQNHFRPPYQHHPNGHVARPPQQHRPNRNVFRPSENGNRLQRTTPPQNHRRNNSSRGNSHSNQHRR